MPTTQQVFETGKIGLTRSRSVFDLSHSNKFTMVAGRLTPVLAYSDVLPGDTHKLGMSFVCRSTTPVAPTMDNAYMQTEFWFVPNQSVLHRASMSPSLDDSNHSWKAFIGAQDALLNMPIPGEITLPHINVNALDGSSASVAKYIKSPVHYLGYPFYWNANGANDTTAGVNFNPFALLAYYSVWNHAYREPNLWSPVVYSIVSGQIVFSTNMNAGIKYDDDNYQNELARVCREHGYFGSALPWPQRNLNGVSLNLGTNAPLMVGEDYRLEDADGNRGVLNLGSTLYPTGQTSKNWPLFVSLIDNKNYGNVDLDTSSNAELSPSSSHRIDSTNLYADLESVKSVSINELRYAFALQGYYEALARMGNRYDDILAYYGVYRNSVDPDCPEYLGGSRVPLDITQVSATSAADSQKVGNLGAFSNTSDMRHYFTKSFTDFGTIIGVSFIRHHDTFYNRLSKERTRLEKFDYWNPAFARIGEVPILKQELFFGVNADKDQGEAVFGYQEYGAEYRYHENEVHGLISPFAGDANLTAWTYASNWANGSTYDDETMSLSSFIDASMQVYDFDQTLVTSADTAGYQFVVDMYFSWTAIRNIPAHSIPALLGGR